MLIAHRTSTMRTQHRQAAKRIAALYLEPDHWLLLVSVHLDNAIRRCSSVQHAWRFSPETNSRSQILTSSGIPNLPKRPDVSVNRRI
jgi:hypothetical protein